MDLELTCTQILVLAVDMKWTTTSEDQKQLQSAIERLRKLLPELTLSDNLVAASRVALFLIRPGDEPSDSCSERFEFLASNSNLNPAWRVKVLLSLAGNCSDDQHEICDSYIARAEALLPTYRQISHTLDVEFIRYSRPSLDVESRTHALLRLQSQSHAMKDRISQLKILRALSEIGSLTGGQGLVLANSANALAARIAYTVGSRFHWIQLQLNLQARLSVQSAMLGKVIEMEPLLQLPIIRDLPFFQYLFCSVLGNIYIEYGDGENAANWATRALQYATRTQSTNHISLAKDGALRAKSIFPPSMSHEAIQSRCLELRTAYLQAIDWDRKYNLVEERVQKILDFVLLTIKNDTIDWIPIDSANSRDVLMNEACDFARQQLATTGDPSFLAKYSQIHATLLAKEHKYEQARDELMEVVQLFHKKKAFFESAIASVQVALCDVELWKLNREHVVHANNALARFGAARDMFNILEVQNQAANCQIQMANIWDLAQQFSSIGPQRDGYISQCLECLSAAEDICERTRQELSLLPSLQSIRAKQSLTSSEVNQRIYRTAIYICVRGRRLRDAWNWVQKYKARSLSDLLGLGCIVPEVLDGKLKSNAEIQGLLKQELELMEIVKRSSSENRLPYRVELENLHQRMKGIPLLDELLALREGRSETIDTVAWLFEEARERDQTITVVDWICVSNFVYIVIVDNTKQPYVERLATSLNELQLWVSTNLTSSTRRTKLELREDQSPLRELDGLIYPLSFCTKPDSLLVLSPSGPLHSIPLHALCLPGRQLLIERNPIVYCPSLSVLHQCVRRAGRHRDTTNPVAAFGVYDNPLVLSEGVAVETIIKSWATRFGGQAYFGDPVTPSKFRTLAENSSLIHFHGHTVEGEGNILEQGIEIYSDGETLNGELGRLGREMKFMNVSPIGRVSRRKLRRTMGDWRIGVDQRLERRRSGYQRNRGRSVHQIHSP